MQKISFKLFMLLGICGIVSACAPALLGAGGAAGVVGFQERTAGTAVDDTVIWSGIKHSYLEKDVATLLNNISVEVNEGRVLLTGIVELPETRVDAVKLAWQTYGVKEVINEIQIAKNASWTSQATDTWITTQVKSKLLLYKDVKSINYSVDTVGGVVYLMGIAQNQEELKLVTKLASTVGGVKRVVSHVRLRDSQLR